MSRLWVPGSNQRAPTDQTQINIDQDTAGQAAKSPSCRNLRVQIKDKMDLATRDSLLQFISRTTQADVTISAFPDPSFLDLLIQTGLSKRGSRDGCVHPASISYKEMRPELLTALMLAGCVCLGFEAINKSGLVLQEVVRLSLERLVSLQEQHCHL